MSPNQSRMFQHHCLVSTTITHETFFLIEYQHQFCIHRHLKNILCQQSYSSRLFLSLSSFFCIRSPLLMLNFVGLTDAAQNFTSKLFDAVVGLMPHYESKARTEKRAEYLKIVVVSIFHRRFTTSFSSRALFIFLASFFSRAMWNALSPNLCFSHPINVNLSIWYLCLPHRWRSFTF